MKKTISILLCVLMLAALLAGCGGTGGNSKGDTAAKTLKFGCQMYSDGMICPWQQTNCA